MDHNCPTTLTPDLSNLNHLTPLDPHIWAQVTQLNPIGPNWPRLTPLVTIWVEPEAKSILYDQMFTNILCIHIVICIMFVWTLAQYNTIYCYLWFYSRIQMRMGKGISLSVLVELKYVTKVVFLLFRLNIKPSFGFGLAFRLANIMSSETILRVSYPLSKHVLKCQVINMCGKCPYKRLLFYVWKLHLRNGYFRHSLFLNEIW